MSIILRVLCAILILVVAAPECCAWLLPSLRLSQQASASRTTAAGLLLLAPLVATAQPASAADLTGEQLFTASCLQCHAGGGNSTPFSGKGKTLSVSDLAANGVDAVDRIAAITLSGRNAMPAFGPFFGSKGNVVPGRVSPEQAKELGVYIMDQAAKGWPKKEGL